MRLITGRQSVISSRRFAAENSSFYFCGDSSLTCFSLCLPCPMCYCQWLPDGTSSSSGGGLLIGAAKSIIGMCGNAVKMLSPKKGTKVPTDKPAAMKAATAAAEVGASNAPPNTLRPEKSLVCLGCMVSLPDFTTSHLLRYPSSLNCTL